jgi:hypothetical protein
MTHIPPRLSRSATALLLGASLVGPASAAVLAAPAATGAEQSAARLEARLRPSGDPDGSGVVHLRVRQAAGTVCAAVEGNGIDQPDAAHVHRRSTGAVVVDLSGSVTGGARCATRVRHRLIAKMLAHPRRFYFNVHNPAYPAGAIQGVLHR